MTEIGKQKSRSPCGNNGYSLCGDTRNRQAEKLPASTTLTNTSQMNEKYKLNSNNSGWTVPIFY